MVHQEQNTKKREIIWKDTLYLTMAVSIIAYVYCFFDKSQALFSPWQKQLMSQHLRSLMKKHAMISILALRDRPTIYRHCGTSSICDLERCPPYHWQRERQLTLASELSDRDYYIIKQKKSHRYFLLVNSQFATNEWFPSRLDLTLVFQIRQAHHIFVAYCVLTNNGGDGSRTLLGKGYATYQQALDDYHDLDGEATSDYEMWLVAEEDSHEQERDARHTLWEEEYDPRYVEHLLASWDTRYYDQADENLRDEISTGLHDENIRRRNEQNRRALALRYCSSPDASWQDITDSIRRQKEAFQVGLPASASWQHIETVWKQRHIETQNHGEKEATE